VSNSVAQRRSVNSSWPGLGVVLAWLYRGPSTSFLIQLNLST
jgi:hypothetical protein